LEEQEVIGFLIIILYLIAMILLLDLWVRLKIIRSELENVLRKIEEIVKMNERREDP
jgi:hypothetical protein